MNEKFIETAVRAEVERLVAAETVKVIDEAKRRIESQVAKLTAGITLDLMKHVSMNRVGDDLVIRVQMEGFKS